MPGRPRRFGDPDHAKHWAKVLGEVKAGTMVLEEVSDPEAGTVEEPRLIFHAGDIPEDLFAFA